MKMFCDFNAHAAASYCVGFDKLGEDCCAHVLTQEGTFVPAPYGMHFTVPGPAWAGRVALDPNGALAATVFFVSASDRERYLYYKVKSLEEKCARRTK